MEPGLATCSGMLLKCSSESKSALSAQVCQQGRLLELCKGSSELPLGRKLSVSREVHAWQVQGSDSEQNKPCCAVRLSQRQQVSCAPAPGAQWVQLRAALSCLYPHSTLSAAALLLWRRLLSREGSLKGLFFVGENKCTLASLGTPDFRSLRAFGKQPPPVFCRMWRRVSVCL